MVNGVADGFFFNFMKKIGKEMEDADDEKGPTVQWERKFKDMVDAKLKRFKFHIFIPLTMAHDTAADINPIEDFLKKKIKPLAGAMKNKKWSRPAFFSCFDWDESTSTLDKLFDIPTAMSVLRENVRDKKNEDGTEMDSVMKQLIVDNDIRAFIGRLSKRIHHYNLEEYLQVYVFTSMDDPDKVKQRMIESYGS